MNRCLIDWFIGELKIGKVFAQLRSFLFMEDGEFGQSVSDQLFEKVTVFPLSIWCQYDVFNICDSNSWEFSIVDILCCSFQLATNPKPHEMLNPMFLNGVLNKAIQYSSSADAKDITSNLSFVLKHVPNILQPNGKFMQMFMAHDDRLHMCSFKWNYMLQSIPEQEFFTDL